MTRMMVTLSQPERFKQELERKRIINFGVGVDVGVGVGGGYDFFVPQIASGFGKTVPINFGFGDGFEVQISEI